MKLPPFGKYLSGLLKSGQYPTNDVYIFIGLNAWESASDFQLSRPGTLCLPPYELPERYIWPVVNCDILIFDTSCDEAYVENVALCLLCNGANIVRYISPDNQLSIYKKDF